MTAQDAVRDVAIYADAMAIHMFAASSGAFPQEERRACVLQALLIWKSMNRIMETIADELRSAEE